MNELKNMRTLQHGNWYQGARWVTVSRRKNKNREDLGGCGLGFRTSYTQNFFFFYKQFTLKIYKINGLYQ